jgi:hypothetical protein
MYYTSAKKVTTFDRFYMLSFDRQLQDLKKAIFFVVARSSGYIMRGCFLKDGFGLKLEKQAEPAGGATASAGYVFGRSGDRPYCDRPYSNC